MGEQCPFLPGHPPASAGHDGGGDGGSDGGTSVCQQDTLGPTERVHSPQPPLLHLASMATAEKTNGSVVETVQEAGTPAEPTVRCHGGPRLPSPGRAADPVRCVCARFPPPHTHTQLHLKLRKPSEEDQKKIKWTEDTVDNEHLGRKSSKCRDCTACRPGKGGRADASRLTGAVARLCP